MRKSLAVTMMLLAGCDLYWGGDDACRDTAPSIIRELRDPVTGQCETVVVGGLECPPCGPCDPPVAVPANPDTDGWPVCNSTCDSLDEQACLATAGCHAAYSGYDLAHQSFWGCWSVGSDNTTQPCTGQTAVECAGRDDCESQYIEGGPSFAQCVPEQPQDSCLVTDCAPGSHCEQQCYPCNSLGCSGSCQPMCVPDTTCADVDCGRGSTCVVACTADTAPGSCTATCVPSGNDPGSCYGAITCTTPAPACPSGTTPGTANGCYTGYCIPVAACSPGDPGACSGTVTCATPPPACPAGTVAGIEDACYSGYCIPENACPAPACETLATEAACTGRADCIPVYAGSDCTCTPTQGCTCQTLAYERCETAMTAL